MRSILPFALASLACLATGCPQPGGAQDRSTLPTLVTDDPSAEAQLRAAREAEEEGRASEAELLYDAFLEEHPTDPLVPLAQLGLGRVQLAVGRVEEALALFAVVETSDDPAVAESGRFYRGVALQLVGRSAEALEVLVPLIDRTVDPVRTLLLLQSVAAAAERESRTDLALTAFDRLASDPDLPEQEREAARADLDRIVEEASPEAMEAAYDRLPRDGAAWRALALRDLRLAFAAGEMERVLEIAEDLQEAEVDLPEDAAGLVRRAERTGRADPNVIGAILPLSGRARRVGQHAARGLLLAAGGVPRGPIAADAPQLILRDDAGDAERAVAAVDDLVAVHRAVAIVGPLSGTAARAAAARAAELGVPMITLVPDPDVVEEGDAVFRLFSGPAEECTALVRAARSRGARRFAILRPTHGYGTSMATAFRAAVAAAGGEVVAEERYAPTATAFGEAITRLSEASIDALFVPDTARRLALIGPALAAADLWSEPPGVEAPGDGRPIALLAPSVALDARALSQSARYLQGLTIAAPFYADTAGGAARAFADAYRAQHAEAPEVYAAYAHDAFRLIRAAVEAGAVTRSALAAWLRASSAGFPTVGGAEGFDANRGPVSTGGVVHLLEDRLVAPGSPDPA